MALIPVNNEAALIALVASGNERAFTALFDAYYKQLGEYVYKLTESIEVTEEIVQDVFIKIWIKREILPELDSFCNYLFILCRNQTLNQLRKKAKEKVKEQEWLKQSDLDISIFEDSTDIEKYRELIDLAIEKLPAQQKKVYKLSREQRLKHEEIAKLLNISTETVKKHIKLALKFIKTDVSLKNNGVIVIIVSTPLFFL